MFSALVDPFLFKAKGYQKVWSELLPFHFSKEQGAWVRFNARDCVESKDSVVPDEKAARSSATFGAKAKSHTLEEFMQPQLRVQEKSVPEDVEASIDTPATEESSKPPAHSKGHDVLEAEVDEADFNAAFDEMMVELSRDVVGDPVPAPDPPLPAKAPEPEADSSQQGDGVGVEASKVTKVLGQAQARGESEQAQPCGEVESQVQVQGETSFGSAGNKEENVPEPEMATPEVASLAQTSSFGSVNGSMKLEGAGQAEKQGCHASVDDTALDSVNTSHPGHVQEQDIGSEQASSHVNIEGQQASTSHCEASSPKSAATPDSCASPNRGVVQSLKDSMGFWDHCLDELEENEQLFDLVDCLESDSLSTSFSGVDAPMVALKCLHWRLEQRLSTKLPKPTNLFMIEWNKEAQEELKLMSSEGGSIPEKDRPCLFEDIGAFWQADLQPIVEQLMKQPTMSVDVLAPRISNGTASTRVAYCLQHRKRCSLKVAKRHVSGTPCVGHSKRGCGLSLADPGVVHLLVWISLRLDLQEPSILQENVKSFPCEVLKRFLFRLYWLDVVVLDACLFGVPQAQLNWEFGF